MKLPVLIPQPQRLKLTGGNFALPERIQIGILSHEVADSARAFVAALTPGRASTHIAAPGLSNTVTITLKGQAKPQGYHLGITGQSVTIHSETSVGAWNGAQTLIQLVRQYPEGRLPCLRIEDWPDFEDRGLYYDVARGRVPTLDTLCHMVNLFSQYKINQFQLYIEHTFAFRRYPFIGHGASPLTADDILTLDAYCRARHIELVPSLASFGHLASVLHHPELRAMAEDGGQGRYTSPDPEVQKRVRYWAQRPWLNLPGCTLSPVHPQTAAFLESLFAEFLPLFTSTRFNVCCDETNDLGWGQSHAMCQKIGRGRVYLGHLKTLSRLAHRHGKRIMFWGDIIRHYPELIPQIPQDVTVLDWGYEHKHPFETIRDFTRTGLDSYVCPSTNSYRTLFPRLHQGMANMAGFAAAGKKYGAKGFLNTEWGDGGHYNFTENSWHGFLFGAEQGWNTKANVSDFTSRFCRQFLNADDPQLPRALVRLGDISHLTLNDYYQSVWRHVFFTHPDWTLMPRTPRGAYLSVNGRLGTGVVTLNSALGRRTLKALEGIRVVFQDHAKRRGEDPEGVLPYWLFAVDAMRHAARKVVVQGAGGRDTTAARQGLKRELAGLKQRFIALWLQRNRPSEMASTLKKYDIAAKVDSIFDPHPLITRLKVSRFITQPGTQARLEFPVDRKALDFKPVTFLCAALNLAQREPGVLKAGLVGVFYGALPFECGVCLALKVGLGYSGPIRVWLDGQEIHHDPTGCPPAMVDEVTLPITVSQGRHELLLALAPTKTNAAVLLRLAGSRASLTPAPDSVRLRI